MAKLSDYLIENLPLLEKDYPDLARVLMANSRYLRFKVEGICNGTRLEPDDVFQQILIKLLRYSDDYSKTLYRYEGKPCELLEVRDGNLKLNHFSFEKPVWVPEKSVDKVNKMKYTSFIKRKIQQESLNIRDGLFRQKEGCILDKGESFLPVYTDVYEDETIRYAGWLGEDPESFLIQDEELKETTTRLSRPAKKFLNSIEYEASLQDNHLVRSIRLKKKRLLFARRETKNAFYGKHVGKSVNPIHLKASAIRW